MTIDHIRPQGPWKKDRRRKILSLYQDYGCMNYNTTSACKRCNAAKGSRELLQFLLANGG